MSPPRNNASQQPSYGPSNNPDLALAQEWIAELEDWHEAHGLCGYDRFDLKQHPRIRGLQQRPLLRKAATVLEDFAPHLARRAFGVQPTENPKAYALMAHGSLRMYRVTGQQRYLGQAEEMLGWLLAHSAEAPGLAWGYPFDVTGSGVNTPAGTPVSVISAIAGQAFLEAHAVLGGEQYAEAAREIGRFLVEGLQRSEENDGTYCFSYTPHDTRRVHNASLLVAEHLFALNKLTGEDHWREAALPALAFTLRRQQPDGSWPYGEWREGEAFEPKLMAHIDHYHTGFVLRSLNAIYPLTDDARVLAALREGFSFYRKLFTPQGMPVTAHGKWPVDIHACAEAILCPAVLSETLLAARPYSVLALRWAWFHMRDHATGAPHYRKYPLFTSRIAFPRWGVAWMYRALAEYLWRFYSGGR